MGANRSFIGAKLAQVNARNDARRFTIEQALAFRYQEPTADKVSPVPRRRLMGFFQLDLPPEVW